MREYMELMSLLNAFIREEKYTLSDQKICDSVLKLSKMHGVYGIASYMMLQSMPCTNQGYKLSCVHAYARMALKTGQMDELGRLLSDHQIDYLPFKGYIVRKYYPVPEFRSFGDVDFLIRKEDRDKCHKLLLSHGFTFKKGWEPVFTYTKGISTFEIHTELLDTDISGKVNCRAFFSDNPWKHAAKIAEHYYEFDSEYHFVYLLTHIAKHINGSGAGIRMYLDLALYIKNGKELDWKWIVRTLKDIGLWTFSVYAFSLLRRSFNVQLPIDLPEIDEEDYVEFWEYTMEAGVFGFDNRDRGAVMLKNSGNTNGKPSPEETIFKLIFPKAKTIAPRYTYLQRMPWLLPVAWFHRLILTRKDTWVHIKRARQIVNTDLSEVSRLEHIKNNLGF